MIKDARFKNEVSTRPERNILCAHLSFACCLMVSGILIGVAITSCLWIYSREPVLSHHAHVAPNDSLSTMNAVMDLLFEREASDSFSDKPADCLKALEETWGEANQGDVDCWPQWRTAWEAGVCADTLGKPQDAEIWMTRFRNDFAKGTFPQGDILYLELVANRIAPTQRTTGPTIHFFEPRLPFSGILLLANDAPDPFSQVIEELKRSRATVKADNSIIERIRLMSWLLLAAELVVEAPSDTPQAALLRNAVHGFNEGFTILSEVEAEIVADPAKQALLTNTTEHALIAMRFDAVRVRQVAMKKRQSLAQEKEFERLDSLREVIAAEKVLVEQIGRLALATLDHDWAGAERAGQQSLDQIAATQNVARIKRDYYLLDEPKVIDSSDQWKALDPVVGPVSTSIASTVKSMMALATARLAEQSLADDIASIATGSAPDGPRIKKIGELIVQSDTLANRALQKVVDDPVDGFDTENPLAEYVRGLVAETRGRLATYARLGDAATVQGAADDFRKAADSYSAVEPLLKKWNGDPTASWLVRDAKSRVAALQNADVAQGESATLTQAGRTRDAWIVLGNAASRHATKDILLGRADAARRGRQPYSEALAELDRAIESKAIAEDDAAAAIARAAFVLQRVGTTLAQRNGIKPVDVNMQTLANELEPVEKSLRASIVALNPDAVERAHSWAWLSLCLAYKSQVVSDQESRKQSVKESQRLAQDALFELNKTRPQKDEWNPAFVEAAVAAQLALGHVALKTLPSHRDESRLAFAAAVDNAASLPFVDADFRMLGSPLLAAIASTDADGGAKLAQEERAMRQMMTRFVEASFALRFGSPEQAAVQMSEAAALSIQGPQGVASAFDASSELARADGFDVHISLPDSIRAFAALAKMSVGESEAALRILVLLTNPNAQFPEGASWYQTTLGKQLLADAVLQVQSPLVAYAIAAGLEALVDLVPLDRVREIQPILKIATDAQKKTDSLLASSRVGDRYPHIQSLSTNLRLRFNNPEYHRERATSAVHRGDLKEAVEGLRSALRRQSNQESLWSQLFHLEIQRLSTRPSADANGEVRKEILLASELGFINVYQQSFFEGQILMLEGKFADAATCFDNAAHAQSSDREKMLAVALATSSRLKAALPKTLPPKKVNRPRVEETTSVTQSGATNQ